MEVFGTSDFSETLHQMRRYVEVEEQDATPQLTMATSRCLSPPERSKNKEINERKKGAGTSHQMRRKVGLDAADASICLRWGRSDDEDRRTYHTDWRGSYHGISRDGQLPRILGHFRTKVSLLENDCIVLTDPTQETNRCSSLKEAE